MIAPIGLKGKRVASLVRKVCNGDAEALASLRYEYPDSYFFYDSTLGLVVYWNTYTDPMLRIPSGLKFMAYYIEAFGPNAQIVKNRDLTNFMLAKLVIPKELTVWAVMGS